MKEARNRPEFVRLLNVLGAVVLAAIVTFPLPAVAQEIPSGTPIRVRMIDKLSSEQNQVGDTFHGSLEEPVSVNGQVLYPKGADVLGRVTDVHKTGQLSQPGELDLVLLTISSNTVATSVRVQPLVIKGESHTRSNTTKIGGGAALGAIVGAIAGGGKGAAVGTAAGAAAGTGVAAATGKKPATVDSEAVLTFITSTASVAAPPASGGAGNPNPPAPATSSTPASPDTDSAAAPSSSSAPAAANPAATGDHATAFTLRDRRIIRACVSEHISDFSPGSTERPEVPAGSEPQIYRGLRLSPDQQKQVQSLPLACEQQLPGLPGDLERALLDGQILLLDSDGRIRDLFILDDQR